ncbi:MAG: ACT domain-containing protein [Deltaproteobacteria bacterium]|nr:ACT domain-containing protein [Deltaproteobacteria bacterium]
MKIKQLSVFIENAPGRLWQVAQALGEAGIDIRALQVADTGEFGVLRLLVSDVAQARQILMNRNLPARVEEVVAVEMADRPGGLAEILKPLLDGGISIHYAYGLIGASAGKAVMVFRFSDNERAMALLQERGISLPERTSFEFLLEKACP